MRLGLVFWVWSGTIILLARKNRVVPGEWTHRMSKNPASSTSRIYVRTSHGRWFAPHQATTRTPPNAWPVWRGHANARPPKAGKVMRRFLGRVQMQHRWHRRVYCGLLQHAHAGAPECCFVSAADASGQRKKWSCSGLWGVWPRHTHTAQHTPRTWRRLTVFAWLSLSAEHTHAAAAALVARAQSAIFLNPHLESKPVVRSYFCIFQIPIILFPLQHQKLWFGFSHAVWNPILFWKSE